MLTSVLNGIDMRVEGSWKRLKTGQLDATRLQKKADKAEHLECSGSLRIGSQFEIQVRTGVGLTSDIGPQQVYPTGQ